VDTSAAESADVDSLGRRTGPRRQHTIEEKMRIVLETHVRGASVATVAQRHKVNPNQVFAWRQLYRRGLLDPKAVAQEPPLLPVTVSTPTMLPSETVQSAVPRSAPGRPRGSCRRIEIKLSNGHSIVLYGRVDAEGLSRVIDLLVQR
jgi:transposase-like protein